MIKFEKFTLSNGLKVIVNHDPSTPIIAMNILYDIGSKDENPDKTGFAHLFEHLMFEGSVNIPNFDSPLEKVGGENNAFTSTDITNYYISVPKPNLETAFWLESDRMLNLDFSEERLAVQKNVVIEEFKQRYLNKPYSDAWLLLRPLIYKQHPYSWATIGKETSHIDNATLDDVKEFYKKHYNPNNAILTLSGDITTEEAKELCIKWFEPIKNSYTFNRSIAKEPTQTEKRNLEVIKDVPHNVMFRAYRMADRLHPDYYVYDLITDILSSGESSRLHQSLVKEQKLFNEIDAFITGETDEGVLIITGHLAKDVKTENAIKGLEEELEKLKTNLVEPHELEKVKNRVESVTTFGEINNLNRAYLLSYFENLGDANLINTEVEMYQKITLQDIQRVAKAGFINTNCSELLYLSNNTK
ncbi:MAG: pitrilysin family protein [Bacteroidota bacterium]|nr:pitrilysin family protein [Bacteroidota bacterium]